MPLMLLVLLAVSLIMTVALQRQAAQSRVVQRQINEYVRRHDAYGVRATVMHWLKNLSRQDLVALASTPGASHLFELPSGARAIARVSDGQGLPLRNITAVDDELKSLYQAMLARLASRPDLTRGVGPWQISIPGAPREVLEAMISENGPELAREVQRMRRGDGEVDRAEYSRVVSTMSMEGDERRFVTRVTAFDSVLWKVVVETEDWAGRRRYDMLIERGPAQTTLHEWDEYSEAELAALGDDTAETPRRENRWR